MTEDLAHQLAERHLRDQADAGLYAAHDRDQCMLCGAFGEDKRSVWLGCFYDIKEVIPEAINTSQVPELKDDGLGLYYLRVCKNCRARLLTVLEVWRDSCAALRGRRKDHDGYLDEPQEPGHDVPIRHHGVTIYVTEAEWRRRMDIQPSDPRQPVRFRPPPEETP